jgi:MarR family transcriptional regulator, temperature-dependent positive regulator of motility
LLKTTQQGGSVPQDLNPAMTLEQQAHFKLLKVLKEPPELSKRQLAEAIGLSLGKTNNILHTLIDKGFLKMDTFLNCDSKLGKVAYTLTAAGISERINLTQGCIACLKDEYAAHQVELDPL